MSAHFDRLKSWAQGEIVRTEVRRVAVARGWFHTPGKDYRDLPRWVVHFPPLPLTHVTIASCTDPTADHGDGGWHVDDLTALLWSLLAGLDVEPVDVGVCPACAGGCAEWSKRHCGASTRYEDVCEDLRAGGWAWKTRESFPAARRVSTVSVLSGAEPAHLTFFCVRPCTACSVDDLDPASRTFGGKRPTGRDLRSPARLLLDAGGDEKAREHVAVLADQWQAAGDPFGVWLTSWLAGWPGDSLEVCTAAMLEVSARSAL